MKHTKTLSYTPSPYSKNSPSLKLKLDFKKNMVNPDPPAAPGKSTQDISIKLQLPQNAPYNLDKKSHPLTFERKIDHTNYYQLSKVLDKDQQAFIKMNKTKEVEPKKSLKSSATSRPQEKLKDKLPLNQRTLDRNKKLEDSKVNINLSNQATSRKTVRIGNLIQNENVEGVINKANDPSTVSAKKFKGSIIDLTQLKPKKVTPGHRKNLSTIAIKKTPKASSSKGPRPLNVFRPTPDNLSFHDALEEYSKTPDPRKVERGKLFNANGTFNDVLANKLQQALKGLQGSAQNARHRRGLSSGQAPIFIEQHMIQEKVKPIEYIPIDPQQEQDEFYEHFFRSDKMTFDFEKLIILQRNKSQNVSASVTPTPTNKQAMHVRTRSIEDPNSVLPTKASSRWNTKRSSVGGDDNQVTRKETSSLMEQVSDLDRTEYEREERQKYLRG